MPADLEGSLKDSLKNDLKALTGAVLSSAESSLNSFGLRFADGRGLLIQAVIEEGDSAMNLASELSIAAEVRAADQIPKLAEAVCSVDWSWIYGSKLASINLQNGPRGATLILKLEPIGPITVSVGAWEGKPFLSFMPYKKP